MILAPLSDPYLRSAVRRAALPEEDVFHAQEEVQEALRLGYPRLLVYEVQDRFIRSQIRSWGPDLPTLALTEATLQEWDAAWHTNGLAVLQVDDSALRLRSLMRRATARPSWVDATLADLTLALGRGLAPSLRGLGRRVMEFPSRYPTLSQVAEVGGLSTGALKARFRRRLLPSPVAYLRWFRILASAQVMSDYRQTTLTASFRLGFTSDGNFCRWIQDHTGLPPSALREPGIQTHLLFRMAAECFPPGAMDAWVELGSLFLRDVA